MDAARPDLPRALLTPALPVPIAIAAAATTTVIAAPSASFRIRIWKLVFTVNDVNAITLRSGANAFTGSMLFQNPGNGYAGDEIAGLNAPLFVLNAAEAFVMVTTTANGVNGFVVYDLAPAAGY